MANAKTAKKRAKKEAAKSLNEVNAILTTNFSGFKAAVENRTQIGGGSGRGFKRPPQKKKLVERRSEDRF